MATTKRALLVSSGPDKLRKISQNSANPQRDLTEFRKDHELGSSRCDALLELLSLMNLSRGEVYRGLLESLVKNLEAAIPLMTSQQQDRLLERSFPFITSDHLRAIPIALLKRRQEIPTRYLEAGQLLEVLDKLPPSVQQQVWESDSGFQMFELHVSPFLESYRVNLGQRHLCAATMAFVLKKK
jgi:hypothetical protein